MGLKAEVDADIKSAFDLDLSDAVRDFIGIRQVLNNDDWLENGNQSSEKNYQGRGVFTGFSSQDVDGKTILQHDVKLIVLQSECDDIQIDDMINDYQVIHIRKDPANVSMTVQLRKV